MSGSDGVFRSLSKGFVKDYTDLLAYRTNFTLSKEIFEVRKEFPEEMYSLTDQWKNSQLAVAHSLRINSDMLVVRALKNSQLTDGESHATYGTEHYVHLAEKERVLP
jgi:protein gp37